jgi:O-6-methylguanine DNA methyltransferase
MSEFSEQVRDIVKNIPKGSVLTYQQVAVAAKRPKAARAVANIMANNFNLEIPCHRVIRSDGTLGGYNRGGTEAKRCILEGEGYTGTA